MSAQPDTTSPSLGRKIESALEAVPTHMHPGLKRYLLHGIMPGGFLQRMLVGDVLGAVVVADPSNAACIPQWERVIETLPAECRGSAKAVVAWCGSGGLTKGVAA